MNGHVVMVISIASLTGLGPQCWTKQLIILRTPFSVLYYKSHAALLHPCSITRSVLPQSRAGLRRGHDTFEDVKYTNVLIF